MNKPEQHEHEFEAAHGLPEPLPPGERILWQGSPDWTTLANQVFHVRTLGIYFAAMLIWRAGMAVYDGGDAWDALRSVALLAPLALLAIGILMLVAWLMSRTSVYTLTDRRVVMRLGIVLCVTFNLPYRMIESASLRSNPDGTGNLALVLAPGERIAYAHLWPHARPWRVTRTEPMLRAIPDAVRVGQLLTAGISALPVDGVAIAKPTPVPARHDAPSPVADSHAGGRTGPLAA